MEVRGLVQKVGVCYRVSRGQSLNSQHYMEGYKKNFTTKQFLFKTLSFNNGEYHVKYECFLYDIVRYSLVTIYMADYSFKKAIN